MSDSFEERLEKAVKRGNERARARDEEAREQQLTAAELKRMHGEYRLKLSEHIERNVQKLVGYFPGFRFETVIGEKGWGAAVSRDDFVPGGSAGKRRSDYSRLEMTIRPFSSLSVLELTAKGTVRNRETFNRTHFKKVAEADVDEFERLIDAWVIEYAEMFAAVSG